MNAPREIGDAPETGVPGHRSDPISAAGARSAVNLMPQKAPRARRPRLPDEERRLLREAEAAFEGDDRRHDADAATSSAWDLEDEATPDTPPSRLFRD